MSHIIYEIDVEGSIIYPENTYRYPIKLQIIKSFKSFQIWFKSGSVNIKCSTVSTELEAKKYINLAMKLAMKNLFVYQVCFFCFSDTFFPYIHCKKCESLLDPEFSNWYIEKEIEKMPKHIFLFNKNVYRPSKRYYSPITRFKTTKELRNF